MVEDKKKNEIVCSSMVNAMQHGPRDPGSKLETLMFLNFFSFFFPSILSFE
jgi:hypothetical protein